MLLEWRRFLLWIQIVVGKQRRREELCNADFHALAHFVDDPQFDGFV